MDKKTPSKPTKSTEDLTSPKLPITIYTQQRANSPSHNTQAIQETAARPKGGASTDSAAPTKGDPSLYESVAKMKSSGQGFKSKGAGGTDSEKGNPDDVTEHDFDDMIIEDWAYPTRLSKSAIGKKEEEQKGREKTPEDQDLPDEVPETPQPERKKQKMNDE